MAAMIFMGTGNNVFANDEVTYDSNMQTKKFDVDVKVGEDGSYTVTENIKVQIIVGISLIFRDQLIRKSIVSFTYGIIRRTKPQYLTITVRIFIYICLTVI